YVLSEAQAEGAVLSTSTQRKLEDAEAAVAKARADGKPDKIADAEKKLARAREDADTELAESADDNAENIRKAMEKVSKAEESLTEVQDANADAAIRLEAAERAIAAARYQALADMATGVGAAFQAGLGSISGFFDEMARLAGIVDETRQSVSRLQMQQVTNHIQLLKAQQDLQVKEWDLQRTRARGAMSIAEAEYELQLAREQATLMGATSIEAMRGAADRFRVTGIFAVEDVTSSVVENSAAVRAAEWGVSVARAQAALDQQLATHEQAIAQFNVVEATLTQNAAVEMLRLQTHQLTQQTAQLYGLTQNAATGAARGFGGVGKVGGGLGKILGGVLAGMAGFAVGGPLGAFAGAGMAISGLSDVIKGGIDITHNKDDMKEAWGQMDGGSKLAIIGGSLLGGAAGAAGGYLGGPEGAQLGAELGATILDTTVGSVQYNIASKIDKINRDAADAQQALTLDIEAKRQALEAQRLAWELESLAKTDALTSQLEYSKLQQLLAGANTKEEAQAIAAAAEIEAERMGHMITIADGQSQELVAINGRLAELVSLTSDQAAKHGTGVTTLAFTLPPGEAFSRDQVQAMFQQAAESLDLRLRELESASEVTADDYYTARVY
uniref:hypothetical protein n=1 Tax=Luteococcus sp. TaxID=1969402 RepID=UPI003736C3F5